MHVNIRKTALLGLASVSLSLFAQTPKARTPTLKEYREQMMRQNASIIYKELKDLSECDDAAEELTGAGAVLLVSGLTYAAYRKGVFTTIEDYILVKKLRSYVQGYHNASSESYSFSAMVGKLEREISDTFNPKVSEKIEDIKKILKNDGLSLKDLEVYADRGSLMKHPSVETYLKRVPQAQEYFNEVNETLEKLNSEIATYEDKIKTLNAKAQGAGQDLRKITEELNDFLSKREAHLQRINQYVTPAEFESMMLESKLKNKLGDIGRAESILKNKSLKRIAGSSVLGIILIGAVVLAEDAATDRDVWGGVKYDQVLLKHMSRDEINEMALKLVKEVGFTSAKQAMEKIKRVYNCQ